MFRHLQLLGELAFSQCARLQSIALILLVCNSSGLLAVHIIQNSMASNVNEVSGKILMVKEAVDLAKWSCFDTDYFLPTAKAKTEENA